MSTNTEAHDLLERAQARLERTGWQRGDYGGESGPNCLRGALLWERRKGISISVSTDMKSVYSLACGALRDVIEENHIVDFNDHICTGQQEAIEVLRLAAKHMTELQDQF